MTLYGRWIVAAALAVIAPSWAGSEKPAGGICSCAAYTEAPTLCAPLSGADRNTCISSNTRWLDRCTAWRSEICRETSGAKMSEIPAAPAQMPLAPSPVAPMPPKLSATLPEIAKFGGSWAGQAQCRGAEDKWRLTLQISQSGDGKLLTTATTSQAFDSFSGSEFQDNAVTLHFRTWLSEKLYTGHLVAPNRIEGKVRIAGSDCGWYLTR